MNTVHFLLNYSSRGIAFGDGTELDFDELLYMKQVNKSVYSKHSNIKGAWESVLGKIKLKFPTEFKVHFIHN